MIPEKVWLDSGWSGDSGRQEEQRLVTHDCLHCTDLHLSKFLSLWSQIKAHGMIKQSSRTWTAPRRQMCNRRGERMEPEMLPSWHHLARVPLPTTWRREEARESVQSQQAQLLFLAWPHAAWQQRHGPGCVTIRLWSLITLFSSSALTYFPSHKIGQLLPHSSPHSSIFCPYLTQLSS